MSFPPTYQSPEDYLEDCVKFFEEYKYIFCHQNTDVLVKNVLDNIDIPAPQLQCINVFGEEFTATGKITKEPFLDDYFAKLEKLNVEIEKIEEREIDACCKDCEAPLSPKKRYEVINMLKEIESVCNESKCDLLVDFGSGLGYLDQIIFAMTNNKVLGIECNESNHNGAQKRQTKYHFDSTEKVKYIKHTINEDSHATIAKYLDELFPNHGEFCIVGLHACADLTVMAMITFLKMADAKSMILMPCCYHQMAKEGGKFKNFPVSECVKSIFEKYNADSFLGVPFLRLATHGYSENKELYDMVFILMSRAVIQLYAHRHGYTVSRNRRKAIRLKERNDFESYILEAATNGYTLSPSPDREPTENSETVPQNDNTINGFDLNELRAIWRQITGDLTLKKAGILLMMQVRMQPLAENFILLDRLMYLKENGMNNCFYKKIFNETTSPRCFAMIAKK